MKYHFVNPEKEKNPENLGEGTSKGKIISTTPDKKLSEGSDAPTK